MSEGTSLSQVIDQVSKDKNIDRKILVEALESAILTAAKRAFGEEREMEAKFNDATGRVDLFQIIIVADPVSNSAKEISLDEAKQFNLQADAGDELLFQIFFDEKDQARAEEQDGKYGALLKLNRAWKTFAASPRKPRNRSFCSGCARPNATTCSTSTATRRAS